MFMDVLSVSITHSLPGVLALLVGVTGWFYLFYSRAAAQLSNIEDERLNARRTSLRRLGAVTMLVLASLIAVGSYGFDLEHPPVQFFIIWLAVIGLLLMITVLGLIDVRLTFKLRHTLRKDRGRE